MSLKRTVDSASSVKETMLRTRDAVIREVYEAPAWRRVRTPIETRLVAVETEIIAEGK